MVEFSPTDPTVKSILDWAKRQGQQGDSMLVHINQREAKMLKKHGGSGKRNPKTGLLSFADGGSSPGDSGSDGEGGNGGTGGNAGGRGDDSPSETNAGQTGGPGAPNAEGHPDSFGADQPSDLGPSKEQMDAIGNAIDAGVFGGIGSPNPEAAMAGLAGLNAVGLGSAASKNAVSQSFADIVGDVLSAMSPISLVEGTPQSIAGMVGKAISPGIPGLIGLASTATKSLMGEATSGLSGLANALGTTATDHSGNTSSASAAPGETGGGGNDNKATKGTTESAPSGKTPKEELASMPMGLDPNFYNVNFQQRIQQMLQQMTQMIQFKNDLRPHLMTIDELKSGISRQ